MSHAMRTSTPDVQEEPIKKKKKSKEPKPESENEVEVEPVVEKTKKSKSKDREVSDDAEDKKSKKSHKSDEEKKEKRKKKRELEPAGDEELPVAAVVTTITQPKVPTVPKSLDVNEQPKKAKVEEKRGYISGIKMNEKLIDRLRDARNITSLFEVQLSTIPKFMEGCDVCTRAHTGSGKTLAFALPILHNLYEKGTVRCARVVVA